MPPGGCVIVEAGRGMVVHDCPICTAKHKSARNAEGCCAGYFKSRVASLLSQCRIDSKSERFDVTVLARRRSSNTTGRINGYAMMGTDSLVKSEQNVSELIHSAFQSHHPAPDAKKRRWCGQDNGTNKKRRRQCHAPPYTLSPSCIDAVDHGSDGMHYEIAIHGVCHFKPPTGLEYKYDVTTSTLRIYVFDSDELTVEGIGGVVKQGDEVCECPVCDTKYNPLDYHVHPV